MSNLKTTIIEINPKFAKVVEENDGYCPCAIENTPDTLCPCKEFREQTEPGECTCGRFKKVVSPNEKTCKTCGYGYEAGYRQVICNVTNTWESENYTCERWKEKK